MSDTPQKPPVPPVSRPPAKPEPASQKPAGAPATPSPSPTASAPSTPKASGGPSSSPSTSSPVTPPARPAPAASGSPVRPSVPAQGSAPATPSASTTAPAAPRLPNASAAPAQAGIPPSTGPTSAGRGRARGPLPVLCALGFLLLLAGLAYLWTRQEAMRSQASAVDPAAFAGAQGDVRGLRERVAQLEKTQGEIGALRDRVAQLEKAQGTANATPASPASPNDLGPIEKRLAALEARPEPAPAAPQGASAPTTAAPSAGPDINAVVGTAVSGAVAPLAQRLDSFEAQSRQARDQIAGKLDGVAGDAAKAQADSRALAARVDDLQKQLAAARQELTERAAQAAQSAQNAAKAIAQNERATVAQQALAKLDAGQPLGDVKDAPPAVARFAYAAPPTMASLRLAFPAAATRAQSASKPSTDGQSFLQRMGSNARSMVTISEGDQVVVGSKASEILAQAHAKLEAGDLAGAVHALDPLDPAAAAAMADWKGQAQSLLDARSALLGMAQR